MLLCMNNEHIMFFSPGPGTIVLADPLTSSFMVIRGHAYQYNYCDLFNASKYMYKCMHIKINNFIIFKYSHLKVGIILYWYLPRYSFITILLLYYHHTILLNT